MTQAGIPIDKQVLLGCPPVAPPKPRLRLIHGLWYCEAPGTRYGAARYPGLAYNQWEKRLTLDTIWRPRA